MEAVPHQLNRLLRPKSIAIVGAGPKEGNYGKSLYESVRSLGYSGNVYLVNPKYTEVDGLKFFPSISAIEERIDCAAMTMADRTLPAALEDAARAGVGSAVVFGRAYGTSDHGTALTEALADTARSTGMSLCGGNCMGYLNVEDRLMMTGYPFSRSIEPGNVSVITHSGSAWAAIIANLRGLKFNFAISPGQELATGVADYLSFMVEQPTTKVICVVLETVRQPEKFLATLRRAQERNIAVIALKLGRSEAGQAFAKSHSGAMSGNADVYDAIFERNGVLSVRTLDEMMDTAELFAAPRRPRKGGKIGLGSDSGGERQLIADIAEQVKLPFAALHQTTIERLRNVLDPGIDATNPLDYWGDGKDVISDCLLAIADDPGVGTVVMASDMAEQPAFLDTTSRALERTHAGTDKPVVLFGNLASAISPSTATRFREMGIPVLMGTETAIRALKHYQSFHAVKPDAHVQQRSTASERKDLVANWQDMFMHRPSTVNKAQYSVALLEDFDIPVAPCICTDDFVSARQFASEEGYPVVAKIDAPDIAHKSDIGGVILGIANDAQLQEAMRRLQEIHLGKVLIQKQLKGTELIIGMRHDAQFGVVFNVGLGGIFVEILRDFTLLLPGDGTPVIIEKLRSLRAYPLLAGARGQAPVNLEKLARVIENFMTMCIDLSDSISEMEINPLLVSGSEIHAVDSLVFGRDLA